MQNLDYIKWNNQEDQLLQKLHKHFGGDFDKVSTQLNSIFQYNKMTKEVCEYRWKYYLDPNINKDQLTQSEEIMMFQMLKKGDLYSDTLWFELSPSFKQRPPCVLKDKTAQIIQHCLLKLTSQFSIKSFKKRYQNRIKMFSIDVIMLFFRLGKEKVKVAECIGASLVQQCIIHCNRMMKILEGAVVNGIIHKDSNELRGEVTEDGQRDFHGMMECLIFMDTIFRIKYGIVPYNLGEQAERDKMETLLLQQINNQQQRTVGMVNQNEHSRSLYYDDQVFWQLTKEDAAFIRSSEYLMPFLEFFSGGQDEAQLQQ